MTDRQPATPTQAITTQVMPAPSVATDTWGAIELVFGGVVALVVLIGGLMTIADRIIAWRKAGESEEAGELGKVETRVKDLEVTCKDFMPRREIEKGFSHERENRLAGEQAAVSRFERVEDRLGATDRQVTRLETELQGQSAAMTRIERMVERVDEKLDRAIAHKPT